MLGGVDEYEYTGEDGARLNGVPTTGGSDEPQSMQKSGSQVGLIKPKKSLNIVRPILLDQQH